MLQYFNKSDFDNFAHGSIDVKLVKLSSTDTYDESAVSKTIEQIGIGICSAIALQLGIVGLGKKTYGKCFYQDKEVDIKQFFDTKNVKYTSTLGTNLAPGDLTPRRLIRFFRFFIQDYIQNTGRFSYLFKKYCPNKELANASFIFPGFEHIAEPEKHKNEVILLIKTYKILDERQVQKINITERIIRVLLAKGFSWEFLTSI